MSHANCAACEAEVWSNHPVDYAAVLYRDVRMSWSAGMRESDRSDSALHGLAGAAGSVII